MLEGTVFKIREVFFPLLEEPDWAIQSQLHSAHLNLHGARMQTFEHIPLPLCAVQSYLKQVALSATMCLQLQMPTIIQLQ